jgi:hypothetical protein|tara:strand:+ start:1255 stop:1536 length:282 start_codon:yes stop_codon:yes gene_type:complete
MLTVVNICDKYGDLKEAGMNDKSSKQERFKRLATKRTNNVLKALKVLGNLSNRSAYDYTNEEVDAIFNAVDKQMRVVRNKFHTFRDEKTEFKF